MLGHTDLCCMIWICMVVTPQLGNDAGNSHVDDRVFCNLVLKKLN